MSILPLQPARVSNLLQSNLAEQSISSTEAALLNVQNELSTGQQVSVVSDNPQAAAAILGLRRTLQSRQSFAANIQNASSQLGDVDTTLSSLTDLLQQAQSLASASVGTDVSQSQRDGNAQIIQGLITQAKSLANTSLNGTYLFGGDKATAPPFVDAAGGIQFVGSTTVLQNVFDQNTLLPTQVNGAHVFGALSSRVVGSADLTPALTPQTRVADLGGAAGQGVHLTTLRLGNGAVTKTVDLSSADTLADVVSAINSAGVGGVTASLGTTGITLTGAAADDVTVADNGGTTAADLGIAAPTGSGAGVPVNGAALQPLVTPLTPLGALRGGAGIDPAGLVISNGTTSATITVPPGATVETLLNAINGSKLGVQAKINAAGNGIDVVNATQGTQLTIGENGGNTAAQLGIRSFDTGTALADLNGGRGVGAAASGGDFTVTRSDGTKFTVSLAGASTVQDVINDINTADGGGGVTASFATQGNGIVLKDAAGGPGTLTVTPINSSTAAADLGLTVPASGNTVGGADVNPLKAAGVFSDLQSLVKALQTGDQQGITAAGGGLKNDYDRAVRVRAQAGASVQDLQGRQSRLTDENLATQSLLSNLQDTDFTAAISRFQQLQTALQASLQTTAHIQGLSLLNYL